MKIMQKIKVHGRACQHCDIYEEMFSCKLSQNENRAQHDRFYVFCNVSDLVLHLTFDS